MGLFSIPVLAPLVVRIFLADGTHACAAVVRDGIPAEQLHHSDTYKSDAANSLKVYGANYFRAIASRPDRPLRRRTCPGSSSIPRTRMCGRSCTTRPKNWVPRLWRRDIKAGHWAPMSHAPTHRDDRCTSLSTTSRASRRRRASAARAGRSSSRILRRHIGFRDRRGQRHRPRDRAGVRPRGRRSGDQRHRRGHASRTPPRRSPPAVASRTPTPSTSPMPTPSSSSPSEVSADTRRARHRGEQRRRRSGRAVSSIRHARSSTGPRHQLRRSRQLLQVIRPPTRRPRHRRAHRQRVVDGRVLASSSR